MNITVLDSSTLGDDLDLTKLEQFGEVSVYKTTSQAELAERIADCDVIVLNKVKLSGESLSKAKKLKLICIAATGYDNIDTLYCKQNGIALCNVAGYSTESVTQITVTLALNLLSRMSEYLPFVSSGEYSLSGKANKVSPPYHEICGLTWGIVGLGNIGRRVADVARALGCSVIACKRTPVSDIECVDIDTLCRQADIISIHTPLTEQTRNLINKERIASMKKNAVLINVARGAVCDEEALANAVKNNEIGGIGIDVYSTEPFGTEHPFYQIKDNPRVCLTPHMAWAAYESRARCLNEIISNIHSFNQGGNKNRIV